MNQLEQGLLVLKKVEQMLYKIYPRLKNFPKSEKFSLCERIKEACFDMYKSISLGSTVKSKRKVYLQEADGHLQILKILIKLANNQKYISHRFYKEIDLDMTEINKLLSGFIRSA